MKTDARRLLAVVASATTVTATEVLFVAGARRLHRDAGSWPFSDESTARATQWAHVLMSEARDASQEEWVAVQAKWTQRQVPVPTVMDPSLAGQPRHRAGIPAQRRHAGTPLDADEPAIRTGAVTRRLSTPDGPP
jgi:hypothetical protein